MIDEIVFEPPELGCVLSLTGLPSGTNKIQDRSPYGNVGTISGATWTYLNGLWYLDYDGTDDKTDCGKHGSLNPTTAITVKLWAYPDTWADWNVILSNSDNGDWNEGYGINNDATDNELKFWVNVYTTHAKTTFNYTTAPGSWYHIVGTYDKANIRIYLSTVEGTAQALTADILAVTTGSLEIGRGQSNSYNFDGKIALVEIHNRAWTQGEVTQSFNKEKHLFGVW